MPPSTGLAITNPLVLYRALLATNRITPDPAQHRLALHLQNLYERLIDYEPRADYRQRLDRVTQTLKGSVLNNTSSGSSLGRQGVWTLFLKQKERRESLALTRVLTNHEQAKQLDSPKGLMLHGEVGTGKSMLIDLFAECLPNKKKRRWHYDAFMLETIARLEQLRRTPSAAGDEYSLMWLAKDLIYSSPILFLDEFQLPDRTAAKIMSNLMTSFFQLGGVLIATSNRMPDELAKAAGVEFAPQPLTLRSTGWRFSRRGDHGRSNSMFAGQGEYADFLSLLRARCEVWEMEGSRDYRRSKVEPTEEHPKPSPVLSASKDTSVSIPGDLPAPQHTTSTTSRISAESNTPALYFVTPQPDGDDTLRTAFADDFNNAQLSATGSCRSIVWESTALKVYGRLVSVPRVFNGVASFTFAELCGTQLGPADYITIASTFHTIIVIDVPVLTLPLKNEARRFITLLDALYEARCKLLISAAAGPDELFFPETRQATEPTNSETPGTQLQDSVYPETFSEIYQDINAPFRPNISPYSTPDTTHVCLQGVLPDDALEDQPPNRLWRRSDSSAESADRQHLEREQFEVRRTPDFSLATAFTGEDERFAYKRAASRLWEMCGSAWWGRQGEDWWRPLPKGMRRWEGITESIAGCEDVEELTEPLGPREGIVGGRYVTKEDDGVMFRGGASPFRKAVEPPPQIGWTHIWGTVKWGKRAGAWGQGVQGLKDRKKDVEK